MTITKANLVTKSDMAVSVTPLANKVVAADVNELKRVTDDLVDADAKAFGGWFICQGTASQTIDSFDFVTVDQWNSVLPLVGVTVDTSPGPSGTPYITIPASAIYRVDVRIDYETDAKNGEVFAFDVWKNPALPPPGDQTIPGLCSRVQHQHAQTTIYSVAMSLFVALDQGDELFVGVESKTAQGAARTFAVKHGAFMVQQIKTGV